MFVKYPLISRLTVFILGPMVIALGWAWWHLHQSLPMYAGRIDVPGIAASVRIERDAHGVPSIVAASDTDAFFAMGFVHAQDRMWQLELQRRIASGRLSEVLGKDSVDTDIWFRTLGLMRSARSAWSALSPQAQASLQAYTDGINRWLASNPVLPAEFMLLGVKPEPWTVYDSLAWVKVFALNLGGNYRREIERLLVAQSLDPAKMKMLFPDYPSGADTTIAALSAGQRDGIARFSAFQSGLESTLQIGGRFVGSNAWVVSGKHTADGAALLANDPHLGLQIPSLWYMASIKGDRIDVQGATLVGLPLVVFGRNRQLAWGGTNLMADAQDIYFEQVKPDDGAYYNVNGQWTAFESHEEIIEVKSAFPAFLRNRLTPLRVEVRRSRHGPVISDMFKVLDQPAALRWTALDESDTSYEAFFRVGYAHDWVSFQAALRPLVAPAMSLVYADRSGNIGYIAAGRIPLRAAGGGTFPVPGWNDEHEWTGAIPFARWPRSFNPDVGFLVTANNKPVDESYPYLISHDWAPAARAERITLLLQQTLDAGAPVDLNAMARIQADTHSEPARKLLASLLQHAPRSERQRRAMSFLAEWQGDMGRGSQAATIFNAWVRSLRQEMLVDDLGAAWNRSDENRFTREAAEATDLDSVRLILTDEHGQWCDDPTTSDRKETADDVLNRSLDVALRELMKIDGDASMQRWAWGDLHETAYRHSPFSQVNVLRSVFGRSIGNGGSPDSINVANFNLEKSGRYAQTFGAGFRQLIAMAPTHVAHRYMNSTGQSGNVMSDHYDDMIEPFRDVHYLPMTSGGKSRTYVLTLQPAAGSPRAAR